MQFNPLKNKAHRAVLGFALLTSAYVCLDRWGWFRQQEQATIDYRYAHWNRDRRSAPEVVVIDIDEQSLKAVSRMHGRWPWPRRVYQEMVEFLQHGEPRAVLFDLLFSEPQLGAPDDQWLGEISAVAPVSHAVNLLYDRTKSGDDAEPLPSEAERFALREVEVPKGALPGLKTFFDYALPVPALLGRIGQVHVVNFDPDRDGVTRRAPLLFRYGGLWFPSLALRGVIAGLQTPRVRWKEGQLEISDADHRYLVPVDADGTFPVHYYTRANSPTTIPFSTVFSSTLDLLSGDEARIEKLKVSPEEFHDKIVIVGTSATGLADLKSTPVQTLFPGPLVQATAIANILQQDFQRRPGAWQRGLWAMAWFGGVIFFFFTFSSMWARVGFSILWMDLFLAAGGLAFQSRGIVLPIFVPGLFGLAAFFDGLVYAYRVEFRERRKLQGTFSKYLAPTVISQILARGEDPRAEIGKHQEITILFADIRNFTTLSEAHPPERIVERLNAYLGRMTDVIFEHQGTLDKFIGDAIMAFWGAPLQDEEHALHAVRCSLAMHRAVAALRAEWKRDGQDSIPFEARIGLNTGQVIVGNIGSEKHLNYTVIGDNVNLASRLEGLTRLYEVPTLIGERTEERVRGRFVCRLVENQVLVKGKAKHVKLYEPLCPADDPAADTLRLFASRFAEALQLYGQGKFEWARKLFAELQQTRPEDGPCRLYLERCDKLIAAPPKNWDGTYVAHSK